MPQNIIGLITLPINIHSLVIFRLHLHFMQKRNQDVFQLNGGTHKFFITRFGFVFQRQSSYINMGKGA